MVVQNQLEIKRQENGSPFPHSLWWQKLWVEVKIYWKQTTMEWQMNNNSNSISNKSVQKRRWFAHKMSSPPWPSLAWLLRQRQHGRLFHTLAVTHSFSWGKDKRGNISHLALRGLPRQQKSNDGQIPQKPGLSALHHAVRSWNTHSTGLGYGPQYSAKLGWAWLNSDPFRSVPTSRLGSLLAFSWGVGRDRQQQMRDRVCTVGPRGRNGIKWPISGVHSRISSPWSQDQPLMTCLA